MAMTTFPDDTPFSPFKAGDRQLASCIVKALPTRRCEPDALHTLLMAEYETRRASAGLLITEATAISHQGQGYSDVPRQRDHAILGVNHQHH